MDNTDQVTMTITALTCKLLGMVHIVMIIHTKGTETLVWTPLIAVDHRSLTYICTNDRDQGACSTIRHCSKEATTTASAFHHSKYPDTFDRMAMVTSRDLGLTKLCFIDFDNDTITIFVNATYSLFIIRTISAT